jgi:hypothetical protein
MMYAWKSARDINAAAGGGAPTDDGPFKVAKRDCEVNRFIEDGVLTTGAWVDVGAAEVRKCDGASSAGVDVGAAAAEAVTA